MYHRRSGGSGVIVLPFFPGYFVGPKYFLIGILLTQIFFMGIISCVMLQFSIVGRMRKGGTEIYLKLHILF